MAYFLAQALPLQPPAPVGEECWLTMLKSGIVPFFALVGVWWTLKGHDQRLRTEQLERRAKDIHRELQQWYGEFVASASEVLEAAWKVMDLHDTEEAILYGMYAGTGPDPSDEEREAQAKVTCPQFLYHVL